MENKRDILIQLKAAHDRYAAVQEFRQRVEAAPEQALASYPLLEPQKARTALQDIRCCRSDSTESNIYRQLLIQYNAEKIQAIQDRQSALSYVNAGMKQTTERVRSRAWLSHPEMRYNRGLIYVPVAFELSSGCSIQCPFCGLAAPRLTDIFRYTPAHARLWQEVLQASLELIGSAAGMGPCYFATEPMDNPDYEQFLMDHQQIFGFLPQTTTAAAHREPERIHAFMDWLGKTELQKGALRFSLYSLAQAKKIWASYTPEELLDIELLANNPESDNRISYTGRCRKEREDLTKRCDYSISCLAGIWVSMTQKVMKWIEPEAPSERYPLGIRILETRSFQNGPSFREGMAALIEHWAGREIPRQEPVRILPGCQLEHRGQLAILHCLGSTMKMGGNDCFQQAMDLLVQQPQSFTKLREKLRLAEFTAEPLRQKLNILWQRGYICRA